MQTKNLTLIIAMLLCTARVFANSTDSTLTEISVNNGWENNFLAIVNYDDNCKMDSQLFKTWDLTLSAWVNSSQYTYKKDNLGRATERLYQYWDAVNNVWVNSRLSLYTYTSDGSGGTDFTATSKTWSSSTGTWVNSSRYIENLNTAGNITYFVYERYINGAWAKQSRNIYQYNAVNLLTFNEIDSWVNNAWAKFNKTNYNFSNNYVKQNSLGYYWDDVTQKWVVSFRDFTNYFPGSSLAQDYISQNYITGAGSWVNSMRTLINVNSDTLFENGINQYWDFNLNTWYNYSKVTQDFYADGSVYHYTIYLWNNTTAAWEANTRNTYTHNSCILQSAISTLNSESQVEARRASKLQASSEMDDNIKTNINELTSSYNINIKNNRLNYYVTVTAKNNLKANAVADASATGISNTGNDKFIISPNPAKDYFTVTPSATLKPGKAALKLYDLSGKLLITKQIQLQGAQKIQLPSITKGIYIVHISWANQLQKQLLFVN